MSRHSHLLAALTLTFLACHDEAKPTVAPHVESSTSAAASIGPAPTPPIVPAALVITESEITLGGTKVMDLPSDRSGGADPKDKRNGKNDLYLVPLANALATDGGRAVKSIVVDVDDTTPYRLLIEVLFTLGQSEFDHWNLRRRGHGEILPITPPRALAPGVAPPSVALVVFLVDGGVSIKTSSGNVASGCNDVGPGLTIPKRDGAQDCSALGACARKLKTQFPNEQAFTFTASPGLPFAGAWAVIDAVRGAKGELFSDVMLGVSR
ncbi:MAG TPA: hypothetical protein VF316_20385 [Polyangiaceae bacterium]